MRYRDLLAQSREDKEFQEIIKDLVANPEVQKMKNFRVHGYTTCYFHCYSVAYYCYLACKKRGLDYKSAARGGMLHDLYLYDWRVKNSHLRPHAFTHPFTAYQNAKKQFKLNWMEKELILTHMWPVTFFTIPLCYEGIILTFIDKKCAFYEFMSSLRYRFIRAAHA